MLFSDVLQSHKIPFQTEGHHHCRSGWIQFDCPFCGPGTGKLHMGYNLAGNYVNCWRCGPHSIKETLQELLGINYWEVRKLVRDLRPERHVKQIKRTGTLEIPKGVGPMLPQHRRYLKQRGYDPDEIERLWGVQGIGLAERLQWRLFIPVVHSGRTVSWTTRSIWDNVDARYISAKEGQEELNHKQVLYGEDYCRHAVIVTEGPTDVWRGGPGFVATLGTSFTRSQILAISRFPMRVICLDSDLAGGRRSRDLCAFLDLFPGETYRVELSSKDLSTAPAKEVDKLRNTFLER